MAARPSRKLDAGKVSNFNSVERLKADRDELVSRLRSGAIQIEEARSAGADVSRWESFWLRLLSEYEEICDQIDAFQAGDAA